jgi:hypothetical protein
MPVAAAAGLAHRIRELRRAPAGHGGCNPAEGMTTDELLVELRGSPTDLARLVREAASTKRRHVVVSSQALRGWTRRDPEAWAKVAAWLAAQKKIVREI